MKKGGSYMQKNMENSFMKTITQKQKSTKTTSTTTGDRSKTIDSAEESNLRNPDIC
jgi:hypothetical protein